MSPNEGRYENLGGVAKGAPVRVLLGHYDEANAYVRGRARWWLERRPGCGLRLWQQSARSTRAYPGNYVAAIAMYLDDEDWVRCAYVSKGAPPEHVELFAKRFAVAMTDRDFASSVAFAHACARPMRADVKP